ncbi:MAG TPA: hypothetical protein DCE71_08470 [Parachlamydiales bacterium]|nr:hypothetical protein [Parachlamydiales bacterium]
MHNKSILAICLCFTAFLDAIEVETEELPFTEKNAPWLTGPLLAPSGNVVPVGSLNVEPYVYVFGFTGAYGLDWKSHDSPVFWNTVLQVPIQFGIMPRVDFTVTPTCIYNQTLGQSSGGFGDLQLATSFQVVNETDTFPSIRLGFQETFPTGKYSRLDPVNLFTDAIGSGAYQSSVGIIFAKLIHIREDHFLNLRFTGAATFSSKVHLEGVSCYGGSPDTKGTYYPAALMTVDIGMEYSFTKNWVGAIDLFYNYATRSKFVGKNGELLFSNVGGTLADVSSQISIAPALEYNFNRSMGLIAGCWVTIAGRNSNIFRSGIIAFNYYK